jgi:hypothetical protein
MHVAFYQYLLDDDDDDMMMFTYIDFIHNKKLENYAPYVKYRPSKKGISKKKATNNTIKPNK